MWRLVPVLAAALFLLPATAARAADAPLTLGKTGDFSLAPPDVTEDAASGWYLRADAGYVAGYVDGSLNTLFVDSLPSGGSGTASGWSVGAGLGYRFTPWLRADVGIDYLDLGGVDTVLGHFSAQSTVALASLYWDIITLAGFTPYVSGGAGFAIDQIAPPAFLPAPGNDWRFAWSLGAGVSYALSSAWTIDLGYRYVNLGAPDLPGLPGIGIDALGGHQLRIGVRYSLGE
ncbi:outer membrane protein [Xanthobacter agilis]|uniref:Opacity protein-like surface antigen n=1 Tax=Xanthobacter agilis TaxID=47492 RepID=A0ABU0L8U3_XANAG|nr:outer membrane beta-barrel protein [Xanthobacter agilis]MDQ0503475.1 opacity protein-like surface antigen [Xanthobacter agilis]